MQPNEAISRSADACSRNNIGLPYELVGHLLARRLVKHRSQPEKIGGLLAHLSLCFSTHWPPLHCGNATCTQSAM
jgi:hypothetical protein